MKMASLLHYRKKFRELPLTRITLLMALGFVAVFVIGVRLFQLQVLQANHYREIAAEKNQGYTEIPARRGEILIRDRYSGEAFALGTNTTLNLIYADPSLIEDPVHVTESLAPLLFELTKEQERDEERYKNLISDIKKAAEKNLPDATATPDATPVATATEDARSIVNTASIEEKLKALNPSYNDLRLHADEELYSLYKTQLLETLSQKTRPVILIDENLDAEDGAKINALRLSGIEVTENGNLYAYPPQIGDKDRTAKLLAQALDADQKKMERILLGKNRYVVIKRKLDPEVSEAVEKLREDDPKGFFGIRMQEEYFRFYPEKEMAAQVLGYVSGTGGQYGIEGSFDSELRGKSGFFTSQIDASGKQITVGDSEIEEAINGSNIMLTVDRAIQAEAEKLLAQGVERANADNGLVIVQEPKTGKILAMAHYPTYNPNNFGDVYKLEEIDLGGTSPDNIYVTGEGDNQKMYLYLRKDPDVRIQIFYDAEKDKYYKYANDLGPEVYQLRSVTLPYEPGSVFKPIAMAAAIDAGEVTPYTTFLSNGPVKVDEFEIHTFNDHYYGTSTMTEVLIHSDNTGMVFIAKKLGRALFFDYLKALNFGEKTNIEFEGENTGKLAYYDRWADSELVTKAFGQGITVTPIQLISAISSIANGGYLMQPYIVEYLEENPGTPQTKKHEFEPKVVRRVFSEETSHQVTAMMTAVVENAAPNSQLPQNYIAGKTGTAQTYKWGRALKGTGTTIVSFIGFAPISDPKFTILVKLDHPKASEWAEGTAGPIFKGLSDFIVNYYNVPPDKTPSKNIKTVGGVSEQ